MMNDPRFLDVSEVIAIHDQEIAVAGGMDLKLMSATMWTLPIQSSSSLPGKSPNPILCST